MALVARPAELTTVLVASVPVIAVVTYCVARIMVEGIVSPGPARTRLLACLGLAMAAVIPVLGWTVARELATAAAQRPQPWPPMLAGPLLLAGGIAAGTLLLAGAVVTALAALRRPHGA